MRRAFAAALCAVLAALTAPAVMAVSPAPLGEMVFFARDSAELGDNQKDKLHRLVPVIRQFSQILVPAIHQFSRTTIQTCQTVRVAGHLDKAEASRGKAGTVDRLRAQAVRDVLREAGLTELDIYVFTYGGDRPLAQNAPDDEPQNRRADIVWSCPLSWVQ